MALRQLAHKLAERSGYSVEAVSLLHSHKIAAEDLGGEPATIVRRRLRELIDAGQRRFLLLPLFLGPSSAIQDYLPTLVEEACALAPDVTISIAPPLAGEDVSQPDPRLAQMLADHVRQIVSRADLKQPKVALVDHGTPVRPVNELRNAVAEELGRILKPGVEQVLATSMERRDGDDYAFNEPLLERVDEAAEFRGGVLIVAMFFLLPGRHAGAGGDVSEICQGLLARGSFETVVTTPLLGEHSGLLDILEDRLRASVE